MEMLRVNNFIVLIIACVSRYSSGTISYYPEFHATKNPALLEKFCHDFRYSIFFISSVI